MRVFSQTEHTMATKPITKRQRYWLNDLNNAAAAARSLVAPALLA